MDQPDSGDFSLDLVLRSASTRHAMGGSCVRPGTVDSPASPHVDSKERHGGAWRFAVDADHPRGHAKAHMLGGGVDIVKKNPVKCKRGDIAVCLTAAPGDAKRGSADSRSPALLPAVPIQALRSMQAPVAGTFGLFSSACGTGRFTSGP